MPVGAVIVEEGGNSGEAVAESGGKSVSVEEEEALSRSVGVDRYV